MGKIIGGIVGGIGGAVGSEKPRKKAAKVSKEVADTQFQYNMDAANAAANLNRYNEVNPYSSTNWTKDPVTGQWSVNQSASPQLQGAIDSSLNMQTAGNKATQTAIGRTAGTVGSAFNPTLPGMGATPTADAAVRFTPNNTQAQTGLGGFGSAYDALFNAGGVPNPQNVQAGSYRSGLGPSGNIMSQVQNAGPIQGGFEAGGQINQSLGPMQQASGSVAPSGGINQSLGLQTGLGNAGAINSGVNLQTGVNLQGGVNLQTGGLGQDNVPAAESYQRGLDYSGAPSLYGSGNVSNDYNSAVSTAFGAQKANIDEAYSTQRNQLLQRLADQGIPMDSEAARFQVAQLDKNRDAGYIQAQAAAANTGLNTQSTLSGLSLANRGQIVGETSNQGQFANQATSATNQESLARANTQFGQNLSAAQFGNQAQLQQAEFGNNAALQGAQFGNNAQLQQAQFGNQAQQQQFAQMLQSGQFGNEAMLAGAQYNLGAQGQQFGQNMAQTQLGNQAAGQNFNQGLQSAQFGNQAQAQQFGQNQTRAQFGNEAQAQQYGQNANDMTQANAAQAQRFGQNLQSGQFANSAQQQQFADQLAASQNNYGQAANTQSTRFGQGFDTQGAAFDQSLAGGQFYNQGQQQQFDQNMNRAGFYNQAAQQDFSNSMASSQQQNALRQQEFGIAADTRAIPINETLGFMKAVQPTPQLPSVQTPAINVDAPNYVGFMNNELAAQRKQKAGKIGAAGDIGSAAGGMIGSVICWVAREVYGVNNPAWLEFREWLLNSAPKWLLRLYVRHGERFAAFISNKPRLKSVIRFFMDKVR
jgi:hypothetical protein